MSRTNIDIDDTPLDCLIAIVAMREGLPLLHRDADCEAIARHAPLRIA